MSTIGSFSNKVFKVSSNYLYTFDDFTRNGELKIDEQEVDGSRPSTYIKGSGLEKVSFNLLLIKQKNINVEKEIDDWFNIMNSKAPHHLIISNKNLSSYKFLLTNVNVSDSKIGANGEFFKASVQLQFSEYVRAGKKEDNATTSSSNTSTSSKPSTSKSSKKTKKRSSKSTSKSKKRSSSSNKSNGKLEALEKELYG